MINYLSYRHYTIQQVFTTTCGVVMAINYVVDTA